MPDPGVANEAIYEELKSLRRSGQRPDNSTMDTSSFATKIDLADTRVAMAELRADLKVGVAEIKASISEGLSAMKSERATALVAVAELGKEMHKLDSAHKTWVVATILSVIGTGLAVTAFLFSRLAPAPAPTGVGVSAAAPAPVSAPTSSAAPIR